MKRTAVSIKNYSAEELKEFFRKDVKYQQAIRLYACYQVALGKKPKDLENLYDTTFKSIYNWVERLNEGGIDALIDRPKSGRPSSLNDMQLEELKNVILNKSPEEYGYNSSTWTGPLAIAYITKEYGVEFKKAWIYQIFKKLGLSFQKGKGVYPEVKDRDEYIEELKKT